MHETTTSAVKGAGAKLLPFRFPGQYQDPEDELYNNIYYNWHRWYIPGIGRYNRADPVTLKPENIMMSILLDFLQ